MTKWIEIIIQFISTLLRGWLSEVSRDNANKEAGAKTAQDAGNAAALERAKNAAKIDDDIRNLDDDALDDRMRSNRQRYGNREDGSEDKSAG